MDALIAREPVFADVSGLLYPRSIAVIGASDREGNLGGDTVERLLRFRFPGPVWAVNPNGGTVRGLAAHRSIEELPEAPDSVVMALPAAAITDTVRALAARGTRNGVAFAGGMSESGGAGIELERALVAACRETGFNLCGPNCVGVINVATPAIQSFATVLYELRSLRAGPISMVTQSGGIGTAAFSLVQQAGFGFRHLISGGNEAVVTFADYLHALACDDGTQVIAGYLEGVGDGPKFLRALEIARANGKQVVLIKSGATAASARAAQAHTGSLVGENRVFDAVLQEMGVIRVGSVEALIDCCLMLAGTPSAKIARGPGVGVVTFGGGHGVLAADQSAAHGLTTPTLDAERSAQLEPLLVSVASAANPMNLTPSTAFRAESLERLPAAMDVLASQPDIQSVILIVGGLAVREKEISAVFTDFWRRCPKTVGIAWPAPPIGTIARFAEQGIPVFDEPDRVLRALGKLAAYGATLERPPRPTDATPITPDWNAFVQPGERIIPEDRCHAILRAANLPVAAGALARSAAEAVVIAADTGLPVVMKGISPAVTHRAAAGLLAVDLRTPADVTAAWHRLQSRAAAIDVTLDGLYVQKMARGGEELLVSVFRDPLFGTMISVGSGGVLTELLDDVVTERAPVDDALAASMIRRLRFYRRAQDAGTPPNTARAAAFIAQFSRLGAGAPWRRFTFEVNPIKWSPDAVTAVDGLLIVEEP